MAQFSVFIYLIDYSLASITPCWHLSSFLQDNKSLRSRIAIHNHGLLVLDEHLSFIIGSRILSSSQVCVRMYMLAVSFRLMEILIVMGIVEVWVLVWTLPTYMGVIDCGPSNENINSAYSLPKKCCMSPFRPRP